MVEMRGGRRRRRWLGLASEDKAESKATFGRTRPPGKDRLAI